MRPLQLIAALTMLWVFSPLALAAEKGKYADISGVVNKTALQPGQKVLIAVVLDVKEKYHAQSHSPGDPNSIAYEVKLDENPAFTAGTPVYAQGEDIDFPALGKLNVYVGKSVTYIPITVKPDAKPG